VVGIDGAAKIAPGDAVRERAARKVDADVEHQLVRNDGIPLMRAIQIAQVFINGLHRDGFCGQIKRVERRVSQAIRCTSHQDRRGKMPERARRKKKRSGQKARRAHEKRGPGEDESGRKSPEGEVHWPPITRLIDNRPFNFHIFQDHWAFFLIWNSIDQT
jgi:hypothetical protein